MYKNVSNSKYEIFFLLCCYFWWNDGKLAKNKYEFYKGKPLCYNNHSLDTVHEPSLLHKQICNWLCVGQEYVKQLPPYWQHITEGTASALLLALQR